MTLHMYEAEDFVTSWNRRDYLGGGGFAAVRRCENKQLGCVAVKCFSITGSGANFESVCETISREPKLLSRIQHPNIVHLYGKVKWDNCLGVVMELVEGGNLQDFLLQTETVKEIPWSLRLRIATELSDALCYLHYYKTAVAFVHGDLKPENILLSLEFHVKLADFGSADIVRATGACTNSVDVESTTQHTILYAAPEVMQDPSTKRKTSMDIYSFAMVLYELMTRSKVFHGTPLSPALLVPLIIGLETRPDCAPIDAIKNEACANDREVIELLEEIMKNCWIQVPGERPGIDGVRSRLAALLDTKDSRQIGVEVGKIYQDLLSSGQRGFNIEPMVALSQFSSPFLEVKHPGVSVQSSETVAVAEPTSIVLLGGWNTPDDVLLYTPSSDNFMELPNLQIGRKYLVAVAVGKTIYAIGGKLNDNTPTDGVERLDLDQEKRSWESMHPMLEKRYQAAGAAWGNTVYVCGGRNEQDLFLSSIECYQVTTGVRTSLGSMKTAREGHSVVAVDAKLYITGGYDGYNRLGKLECFDTSTGQSTYLCEKDDVVSHHAAAHLDGRLYVLGGIDGNLTFLRRAARYSIDEDCWLSSAASMVRNRVSLGCCVVTGKLYAIGGRSYKDSMTTIECYDPATNEWKIVANLEKEWYRHATVAV